MSPEEKIAKDWIRTVEGEKGKVREADIYPRLRTWVEVAAPMDILEIGCGQGICSEQIDLTDRTYTGVDASQVMVDRAEELYSQDNRSFLVGDACELPAPDESFDAAFSVAVLHLVGDVRKAMAELSRVLLPGGHFLIISASPNAYSSWTALYTETTQEGPRFEGSVELQDKSAVREVLYLHPLEEIQAALQGANLVIEESDTFRYWLSLRGRKLP